MSGAAAELRASLERYRPRVRQLVRGLVRNAADAEDLTQETFLRAHRRLEALQDPQATGAWLCRIAANVCRDHLRQAQTRRGTPQAGVQPEELEVPVEEPPLDEVLEHEEMSSCGAELLERIPRAYRQVLLLHDFQGLTTAEVAKALRCTPGAVKIRLHRARARFRLLLLECCDLYHDSRGALRGVRKEAVSTAQGARPTTAASRARGSRGKRRP